MLNRETLVFRADAIDDERVRERVLKGIDVLCDYDPEWAEYVDPSELNMADPNECLLGHVFENHVPAEGVWAMFISQTEVGQQLVTASTRNTLGLAGFFAGLAILYPAFPDVSHHPADYAFDVDFDDLDVVTAAWLTVLGYEDDERVDPLSVGR